MWISAGLSESRGLKRCSHHHQNVFKTSELGLLKRFQKLAISLIKLGAKTILLVFADLAYCGGALRPATLKDQRQRRSNDSLLPYNWFQGEIT
jgi:hypothetical protein